MSWRVVVIENQAKLDYKMGILQKLNFIRYYEGMERNNGRV